MATAQIIPEPVPQAMSVEEYLRTVFEPDMDYVDGVLEERNLGEWEHGDLQTELAHLFRTMLPEWRCRAAVECRLQVAPVRYRIPDIMVLHPGQPAARIIRQAPLICVEVLSPEDRWRRLEVKFMDYIRMGVQNVWVIDPASREAFRLSGTDRKLVEDHILTVPGTAIHVDLNQVFARIDAAGSHDAE